MSGHPEQSEPKLDAPPRLAAALRSLHLKAPAVPQAVDGKILSAARVHLRSTCRSSIVTRGSAPEVRVVSFPRVYSGLAVAAALALGLGLAFLFRPERGIAPTVVREDIDHSGRVDILDAFALARRLKIGAASAGAEDDVNGDGVFDQRDIDRVAARAVKLTKG